MVYGAKRSRGPKAGPHPLFKVRAERVRDTILRMSHSEVERRVIEVRSDRWRRWLYKFDPSRYLRDRESMADTEIENRWIRDGRIRVDDIPRAMRHAEYERLNDIIADMNASNVKVVKLCPCANTV